MSVGTLPPAAAQCSKYHVSHFRGLSFHIDNVAKIENIAAAVAQLRQAADVRLAIETEVIRTGSTLCFAQSLIKADDVVIARANATFRVVPKPKE